MQYIKPIEFNSLIKSAETEDGSMVLYGPIAPEGEDYDGDILTKSALQSGLDMFKKLNCHVDFNHKFRKTDDPKWLIGKGTVIDGPNGRPWLKTTLYKRSDIAQEVWNKIHEGATFGYSVDGILGKRDDSDPRKITRAEFHRITIAPSPKGFGNFLRVGEPPKHIAALAKSVCSDLAEWETGKTPGGWITLPDTEEYAPENFDARLLRLEQEIQQLQKLNKALTTSSGIVQAGTQGGAALRVQQIAGSPSNPAPKSGPWRCPGCRAHNNARRSACRECGQKNPHSTH